MPAMNAAAYRIARRIRPSMTKAQKRAESPAGRISSRMPSGVSAATTESSTSGDDDDRVRDPVVNALARITEDQQAVDEEVETEHAGDQPVHDVAQPEDAPERSRRAVGADHLDPQPLLRDGLA